MLTFSAWFLTSRQVEEKREQTFRRETERVVEMISERLANYEDALWAGVAHHQSTSATDSLTWKAYTERLRIGERYPGINGIGVVYYLHRSEVSAFLEEQREQRPDFQIHPQHEGEVLYPITYLEPLEDNVAAIGLDLAHEKNRFEAAEKARSSGTAQITGPIVLVQDSEKTPGFLFYAPFSKSSNKRSGFVYAPFVVHKLMDGTLRTETRHVSVRISDGEQVLYDELRESEPKFDPESDFQVTKTLTAYGRCWTFEIRSAKSFRGASNNRQPWIILFVGLIIDALLLFFFVMLTSANRRAILYADTLNEELSRKTKDLERQNEDLERFAFVASHDLQEPLRMVGSFADLLGKRYAGQFDEKGERWLGFLVDGARRMRNLVRDLLLYSRSSQQEFEMSSFELRASLDAALTNLEGTIQAKQPEIVVQENLPSVHGHDAQVSMVLQNLISNSLKFVAQDITPRIEIRSREEEDRVVVSVSDNGIGVEPQYLEQVFTVFKRLHGDEAYEGTGIGLSICKRVIERQGGTIWIESQPGRGTTVFFTLLKRG